MDQNDITDSLGGSAREYPNIVEVLVPTRGNSPDGGGQKVDEQTWLEQSLVHNWSTKLIYFFGQTFGGATSVGMLNFNLQEIFDSLMKSVRPGEDLPPFSLSPLQGIYLPQNEFEKTKASEKSDGRAKSSEDNETSLAYRICYQQGWPTESDVPDFSSLMRESIILIRSHVEADKFNRENLQALGFLLRQMCMALHQDEIAVRVNGIFRTISYKDRI